MSEPVTIDNFKPLAKLVAGYELQPGRHYLIVCGPSFAHHLAESLFQHLREEHPEISIQIVATTKPKEIEVREDGV